MKDHVQKFVDELKELEAKESRKDSSHAQLQDMKSRAVKLCRILGKEGVTIDTDSDFTTTAAAKAGFPDIAKASRKGVAAGRKGSKAKVQRSGEDGERTGVKPSPSASEGESTQESAEDMAQKAVQEGRDAD